MLDIADRVLLKEGECVQSLFQHTEPKTSVVFFHPPSNHWPLLENENVAIEPQTKQNFISSQVPVANICLYIMSNYDACVVGGSADSAMDDSKAYLAPLLQIIQHLSKHAFPFLGICYGAQALARAIYGKEALGTMQKRELGCKVVTLVEPVHELFANCPAQFATSLSHGDCFASPQIETLCTTTQWQNQAYHVHGTKSYGLQFHPEFSMQDAQAVYDRKPEFVAHDLGKNEPNMKVSYQIAQNFVTLCLKK